MNTKIWHLALSACFFFFGFREQKAIANEPLLHPRVELTTSLGSIVVELEPEHAPLTSENFLHYVVSGAFDHSSFYRTVHLGNQPDKDVKIEVVQGGLTATWLDLDPIPLETTAMTGLRHHDGTLSMARAAPASATGHFFICLGEQPELDFGGQRNPDGMGFAAFGHVVSGMDVVQKIQGSAADGQVLIPSIEILSARLVQDEA